MTQSMRARWHAHRAEPAHTRSSGEGVLRRATSLWMAAAR